MIWHHIMGNKGNSFMLRQARGNTITEYALIGALVVCLALTGLNAMGATLKDLYTNMVPTAPAPVIAGTSGTTSGGASGGNTTSPGLPPLSGLSAAEMAALQEPLSKRLQTTGANGSTNMLADYLQSVAQQKLAEGKITQDQANTIIALANQAHQLASVESLLEMGLKQANGNYDTFMNSQFTVNGQTYNGADLTGLLSMHQGIPSGATSMDELQNIISNASGVPSESTLKAFLDLYSSVEASGALNDPDIKAIVDQASQQVTYLSDSMVRSVWFNEQGQESITPFPDPSLLLDRQVSNLTNTQANTICFAGNGQEAGSNVCTP